MCTASSMPAVAANSRRCRWRRPSAAIPAKLLPVLSPSPQLPSELRGDGGVRGAAIDAAGEMGEAGS